MRLKIAVVVLAANCLRANSSNFNDVVLEISANRKPAVYHIGERIELRFTFSTTHPGKYGIEYGDDLPGQLKETYVLVPADGAENPRAGFNQLGFVMAGSILQGYSYNWIGGKSRPITADLNERLRFKTPGHYRFHIVSSRISYFPQIETLGKRTSPSNDLQITSNEIELTILPASPDWVAHELEEIRHLFDTSRENEALAARRLRYLNAREAVPEMVRRLPGSLNQPYHSDLYDGLRESSWSREVIASLEETLRNPESRVSYDTVELLATVVLMKEYRNKPLPTTSSNEPQAVKAFRATVEERRNRFKTLMAQYTSELAQSVPARSGKPRADAIFALWKGRELSHPPNAPVSSELPQSRQSIVSVAEDLSFDQLYWLLSIYWAELPKTKLLPLVKDLAIAPEPIRTGQSGEDLRNIAASRWCELDADHCTKNPELNR